MRRFLAALIALLAPWAVACHPRAANPSPEKPPNVLLLVIDAMRGDRLGANGYPLPTTPHLDRLAASGVNFTAAFSNATWTKPSMATLMTSLYPSSHFVLTSARETGSEITSSSLPEGLTTMAELFQAGGYRTGAFVVQPHLTRRLGFAQGFETFEQLRGKSAARQGTLYLDWRKRDDGRPSFAWIHYLDVHYPYDRRPEHSRGKFGSIEIHPEPPKDQLAPLQRWWHKYLRGANLTGLVARYDEGVAFTDDAIGDLLDALQREGALDDTIVVVTADHGEAFLEHGQLGHGFTPYDEQARIPLIFHLPPDSATGRGERRSLVSLVDLLPTLLELAGLSVPSDLQGHSFAGIVRGEEEPERAVFFQTDYGWGARTATLKLIARSETDLELYDLTSDPTERQNLLQGSACTGTCRTLLARLVTLRAKATRRLGGPAPSRPLSPEDVQELRSLGYL